MTTEKLILEFHGWRAYRPDDDNELIILFSFSLMPESERKSGKKPEHEDVFWCEARLQRFLASKPGWAKLSKDEKIRVLFHHACQEIRAARRKLRQVRLFWTPTAEHRAGPSVDPASIVFPAAPPIEIEPEDPENSVRFSARSGAGLAG